MIEMQGLMPKVAEELLNELQRVYASQGKITDEILSSLQFIFQPALLPALDLVDKRAVTLISGPSGRALYQVIGSSGIPYTCFQSSNYCTCPAYRFSVLQKEDHLMCKHVLAVHLSDRMSLVDKLDVSDQELSDMIKHLTPDADQE